MSVLTFQTCYVMYMYIRLQHYRVWLFESYIKMWPIIYSYFYCDFILELNIVMNILKLFILILKMHVHVSSLKIINKICCIYMYNFLFSLFENIGLIKVKIIKIQSLMNTKKHYLHSCQPLHYEKKGGGCRPMVFSTIFFSTIFQLYIIVISFIGGGNPE